MISCFNASRGLVSISLFVFHFLVCFLVSCLALVIVLPSMAWNGLEWFGLAPRAFGRLAQGSAISAISAKGERLISLLYLVYFLYISSQGIFEHFSVFSYTPMVAGAIHVRTGRNAIGLAQNLDLFAASPKRFFLLPPCGPFCCPRLPLAGSVVWGRPLLFSFLFPSRFFLPP